MPELPEAETIARGLRAPLLGRTLDGVEVIHPDLLDVEPAVFAAELFGSNARLDSISPQRPHARPCSIRIVDIGRRGKNVILVLTAPDTPPDESTPNRVLVVNLGMSGRLLWRSDNDPSPAPSHPAVIFRVSGAPEGTLVYHDPRRFGRIRLLAESAFAAWSETLGPEPLDPSFTPEVLAQALSTSASPIRSWLLDQRRIAGVGNIYASEACHGARIHPQTPARNIKGPAAARLHENLVSVLEHAVAQGGTTLRDYRTAQGWEGAFQHKLQAYGRETLPCPNCGTPIKRIVFSNRSAFFCPTCQPFD